VTERVLVTGATGFIGRAVTARLNRDRTPFLALDSKAGDIAAPETLAALRGESFSAVIHLAGRSFVPDSWAQPDEFARINVQGTMNVLELCRARRTPLVFASAYVYGNPLRLPISEEDAPNPNNPYAQSKYLAEQACRSCYDAEGFPITVLRLFNVYGPNQRERFLIPTIIRQVLRERAIEVLDLRPRRDWVFVSDVAEAIVAAATRPAGFSVYNIGSGSSVSVEELIRTIQAVAGTDLPVHSKEVQRADEIADTVAQIEKARSRLGWSPRVSLRQGLQQCIEAAEKR
jgi:nucleoside-diphosphate-sugar epimerase